MRDDFLNRYTTLPYLIDALHTQSIAMRSPENWEDRNDRFYLERYKERKELTVLLAVCFTATRERFHHWKCFGDGASGVCIEFRKAKLLKGLAGRPEFRTREVEYEKVATVEERMPDVDSWPFLKRLPFMDEREFRIIFESQAADLQEASIPFTSSCIRRITLSPWLAKSAADNVIRSLRSIGGCSNLKVSKSTLLENARWRKAIHRRRRIVSR